MIPVHVRAAGDAFGIRQQMAAKMLLNAHSTAVMAKLGKVVGNTMTNVSPSNLKLIGRATFLIQSHVNDVLGTAEWVKANGRREPVSYGEANAVLYDAIAYLRDKPAEAGQTAEVAFSIIRILESLRLGRGLDREEALALVEIPRPQRLPLQKGSNLRRRRDQVFTSAGFLPGSVKTWSLLVLARGRATGNPDTSLTARAHRDSFMVQASSHRIHRRVQISRDLARQQKTADSLSDEDSPIIS